MLEYRCVAFREEAVKIASVEKIIGLLEENYKKAGRILTEKVREDHMQMFKHAQAKCKALYEDRRSMSILKANPEYFKESEDAEKEWQRMADRLRALGITYGNFKESDFS